MLLQHQLLLSAAALLAAGESTTIVSLFWDVPVSGSSMAATGYVAAADATATTYVLDCEREYCAFSTRTEYARITAGPGWQEYNRHSVDEYDTDDDGNPAQESVQSSCTFVGGTTEATCEDFSSTSYESTSYEAFYWNVTYLPTLPESRGQQNFDVFPGLQPMLITSGVELLAGTATATATTTGDSLSNTATATGTGMGTGTDSATSTTGTATSDAGPLNGHQSFLFGIICLTVIAVRM
ncbi:hypothetical protein PFICI_13820 [Pestalotiopsis fici W106-1]|uniref:Uncharacterized protein n=1 Tax=Pestalotiopsis fici (strain W106-1 / CGMCC3.15140) TaxID=1229662 RepID=W3WJK5_PESFW|nr:uncharacterized protein PFICI_13820 [Pestalotiopsis fici W106-1]ETS73954.1 hypothetical protein PFICI_13820 [Pestalotiopsis fici W106-1]